MGEGRKSGMRVSRGGECPGRGGERGDCQYTVMMKQ